MHTLSPEPTLPRHNLLGSIAWKSSLPICNGESPNPPAPSREGNKDQDVPEESRRSRRRCSRERELDGEEDMTQKTTTEETTNAKEDVKTTERKEHEARRRGLKDFY